MSSTSTSTTSSTSTTEKPIYEQGIVKMKQYLDSYGVSYADCVEKSEIVDRVQQTLADPWKKLKETASTSSSATASSSSSSSSSTADGKVGSSIPKLLGDKLVVKSGGKFNTSALQAKVIALYFSAHWCGPCRQFTPVLTQLYNDSLKKQGVEVIFISADQNALEFAKYYGSMPWLAIPFESSDIKEELNSQFGIQGIPALIVLDAHTGKLISKDGRRDVMQEKGNVGKYWLGKTSSSKL